MQAMMNCSDIESADLVGKRYGRLIVTSRQERRKSGKSSRLYFLCKCSCGNEKWVSKGNLISGNVRSCGCLAKDTTISRSKRENKFVKYSPGVIVAYDSKGDYFLFDEDDFEKVKRYCWNVRSNGYVQTNLPASDTSKRKPIVLHRYLLDMLEEEFSWDRVVDHINGNPRDNRRCNLRIVSQIQNSHNRAPRKDSSTGITGVTKCSKEKNTYIVRVSHKGSRYYAGYFEDFNDAKAAALDLHNKFYEEFSYETSRNIKE